jgi:hypothetical protein
MTLHADRSTPLRVIADSPVDLAGPVYRDELIASLHGMVGKNDAYDALWDKVSGAITDAYPHLCDACLKADQRREDAAMLREMYG